jgi:hypothetical protein
MTAAEQLAEVRRKLGLSLDDISSRTKISVERLTAIERVDPEGLPPFVYLKGFIRAYAAEVGLDPDAVSDRYISEVPAPSALASPKNSSGGYIIATGADAFAEFESEDDGADAKRPPSASRVAFVPPVERSTSAAAQPPDAVARALMGATHARVAAPTKYRKSFPLLPLVLASTVAMVGGYLLSANVGRGASRHSGESPAESASGRTTGPDRAASSSAATTSPQTMDPDRTPAQPARRARGSEVPHRRMDVRRQTSAAPSNSRHTSTGAARPREPAVARAAVGDPETRSASPQAAQDPTAGKTENADPVSGAWNITSKVESATFAAYKNLMLGFRLELEQRGDRVVGEGHKISENGAPLPARRRTPIKVAGTLEGDRLALDFTEIGARRTSGGRFVLYRAEDGSFRGHFTSDAAQSSGVTVAVHEPSSGRN